MDRFTCGVPITYPPFQGQTLPFEKWRDSDMSSFFGEAEGGIFAPNQDPLSHFLFEPPLKRSVSSFLFERVAHHLHITHQRTRKHKHNPQMPQPCHNTHPTASQSLLLSFGLRCRSHFSGRCPIASLFRCHCR